MKDATMQGERKSENDTLWKKSDIQARRKLDKGIEKKKTGKDTEETPDTVAKDYDSPCLSVHTSVGMIDLRYVGMIMLTRAIHVWTSWSSCVQKCVV